MGIMVGSARIDENGQVSGGAAGDQKQRSAVNDTVGEVSLQNMYVHSKGWYILRPKDVAHAGLIASKMIQACNNANIGYDQGNRLGVITYGIGTAVKTECDCSSLVRACVKEATGKDSGNFTTINEASMLEATGLFEKRKAYVSQAKTPVFNGDVLVTKTKGHTVVVTSGNPRISQGSGSATGGNSGASFGVGDIVSFSGTKHYASSTAANARACKAGRAKVTAVAKGAKHPYHLIAEKGSRSTVYGWVDAADVSGTAGSSGGVVTHTVQKGDTLSALAKKYGTTVAKIVAANKGKYSKITASYVVIGWVLTIPQ